MTFFFAYIDGHLENEKKNKLLQLEGLDRFEEGPKFCVAAFTRPLALSEFEFVAPNWCLVQLSYKPFKCEYNYTPSASHYKLFLEYRDSLRKALNLPRQTVKSVDKENSNHGI